MAPPIGSCERAWWCTVGMGCASTPSQQKYSVVRKRYGSISNVSMSRDSMVWETARGRDAMLVSPKQNAAGSLPWQKSLLQGRCNDRGMEAWKRETSKHLRSGAWML